MCHMRESALGARCLKGGGMYMQELIDMLIFKREHLSVCQETMNMNEGDMEVAEWIL